MTDATSSANAAAENPVAHTPPDPWGGLGALISRIALERAYWVFPILFWTALVGGSLVWNWAWQEQRTFDLSANQARQIASVIESMRLWNADHGGVYVFADLETPPNPYLQDPDRDIAGPGGRPLTKINPEYMTRQVLDVIRKQSGVSAHLTSRAPINSANQPDPWESASLAALEKGEKERIEQIGGTTPMFRYMMPLVTAPECIACHAKQGYRVGEVRGGLAVSFSPAAFLAIEHQAKRDLLVFHAVVWIVLSFSTVVILMRLRHQIISLREAKSTQDELVNTRTWELRHEVHERQQAEERLRLLIDSSGQGILAVDRNGLCTLCNPTASALLGYETAQLLGHPLRDLIAHTGPDGRPRDVRQCPFTAAYRDGVAAHEIDTVFWCADDTALPVEYRSRPIFSDGALEGAVINFTDIGERKRNETRLRVLSAAIEHSPTAVAIVDVHGIMEYVNAPLADMSGYRVEELLHHPLMMLCADDTPSQAYDELWRTIRGGGTWHGELPAQRADGSPFWQLISISPILDASGQTTHFVATFQDVTERKRAQDAVWRQANYDALTGLPNRNLFLDRLSQLVEHGRRNKEGMAVLYIDLDGFKEVNDRFGHNAGDAVLRSAGQRIGVCLRSTDTVARLGGDEFAIVLPSAPSRSEAEFVAVRIIEALAAPFITTSGTGHVSASIGIAVYSGGPESAEELIRRADRAMYAAKREGGKIFRFYQEGLERLGAVISEADQAN